MHGVTGAHRPTHRLGGQGVSAASGQTRWPLAAICSGCTGTLPEKKTEATTRCRCQRAEHVYMCCIRITDYSVHTFS